MLFSYIGVLLCPLWAARNHDDPESTPPFFIPPSTKFGYSSKNLSFDKVLKHFQAQQGLTEEALYSASVRAYTFEAHQLLVTIDSAIRVTPMFRGNSLVALSDVSLHSVQKAADAMASWLCRQIDEDGRMPYKYWPSRGAESNSNNMIRQFMATVCLGRLARHQADKRLADLAALNLAYNLGHFYREEDDIGYIEYNDKVKLGAAALAALAIIENPQREQHAGREHALCRFVDSLYCTDGHFQTFFKPPGREGNDNFYPGEALLLWSHLLREQKAPARFDRFMRSVRHYRTWHRANRNPAFVPWHTQACYIVWQETGDQFLANWILEMNDWLLHVQQCDEAVYDDVRGRFYSPHKPYGPPHASSTGVYLEGLTDAFLLARRLGDTRRAESYRRAIVWGLRSVLQLQFADEDDMFYISRRDRVQGALRTTVYHNEIRVDNVQHALMAILKILNAFRPYDFILAE